MNKIEFPEMKDLELNKTTIVTFSTLVMASQIIIYEIGLAEHGLVKNQDYFITNEGNGESRRIHLIQETTYH